jgi:hypothetical protein
MKILELSSLSITEFFYIKLPLQKKVKTNLTNLISIDTLTIVMDKKCQMDKKMSNGQKNVKWTKKCQMDKKMSNGRKNVKFWFSILCQMYQPQVLHFEFLVEVKNWPSHPPHMFETHKIHRQLRHNASHWKIVPGEVATWNFWKLANGVAVQKLGEGSHYTFCRVFMTHFFLNYE